MLTMLLDEPLVFTQTRLISDDSFGLLEPCCKNTIRVVIARQDFQKVITLWSKIICRLDYEIRIALKKKGNDIFILIWQNTTR